MVSKNQLREQADLQASRDREHVTAMFDSPGTRATLVTVQNVLAERAAHVATDKRSGWKGKEASLLSASDRVRELVDLLDSTALPPPADKPNPHRDPLTTDEMRATPMAVPVPSLADGNVPTWTERTPEYKIGDTVTVAGIEFVRISNDPFGPSNACPERMLAIDAAVGTDAKLDAAFNERLVERVASLPDATITTDPVAPSARLDIVPLARPAVEPIEPRPRMTLDEIQRHGVARQRGASHRSHSQLTSFENCGVQYALSDLERVPAWWNVGGTAVHAAIELANRVTHDMDTSHAGTPYDFESLGRTMHAAWSEIFAQIVAEHEFNSWSPHESWRAAGKGAEAYDWWRVEGEAMVSRWVGYLARRYALGWSIMVIDAEPVIEFPYVLPIFGCPVPDQGVIDVAFVKSIDGQPRVEIVDMKAGKGTRHDHMQVGGQYRWAVQFASDIEADRISGFFWQARTDVLIPAREYGYAEVCKRLSIMDATERAGLYQPRTSNFCSACAVSDLCPVGPQA